MVAAVLLCWRDTRCRQIWFGDYAPDACILLKTLIPALYSLWSGTVTILRPSKETKQQGLLDQLGSYVPRWGGAKCTGSLHLERRGAGYRKAK